MTNSYLRFLRLADTLTKSSDKPLDSLSKDILEHICKGIALNKTQFTVKDILCLGNLGSQATLHKRLHSLVDDGYLQLKAMEDGRVKRIEPTSKSKKYFNDLSKALEKASKA